MKKVNVFLSMQLPRCIASLLTLQLAQCIGIMCKEMLHLQIGLEKYLM